MRNQLSEEAAPAISNGPAEKERYLPGEEGIWVFVFMDMLVFSLFFLVYLYYRNLDIDGFVASQASLNRDMGAINTLLLLTSSWFVASGLHLVRRKQTERAACFFFLAILCGLGFGLVKYLEWGAKISAGYTLTSDDFFMYYYILTGVHFIHVIIGIGVLVFLTGKARSGHCSANDISVYESGGVYWHMVDLLWIVLFPLLYLVR